MMQRIKKWIKSMQALTGKKKYIRYGMIAIICIVFFGIAISRTSITPGNLFSSDTSKTQESSQSVRKDSGQTSQNTKDTKNSSLTSTVTDTKNSADRSTASAGTDTAETAADENNSLAVAEASTDTSVDTGDTGETSTDSSSTNNTDKQTANTNNSASSAADDKQQITVTIEIRCDSVSGNGILTANGHPEVEAYAQNPLILQKTLTVTSDSTVYDVLLLAAKDAGIAVDSTYSAQYQTAYINGINYIYQKYASPRSGWMYQVNQSVANYGCSQYVLKDGDTVLWYYTV